MLYSDSASTDEVEHTDEQTDDVFDMRDNTEPRPTTVSQFQITNSHCQNYNNHTNYLGTEEKLRD